MNDALPIPYLPSADESAISFVENLARANGLRLRSVLSSFTEKQQPSNWNESQWEGIVALAGTHTGALNRLRHRSAGLRACPDAVLMLGLPLKAGFIHERSIRICPACMTQSEHIRDIWNVAHAAVCPIHRCLLVERCPCGSPLHVLQRGREAFTCRCNTRFADMPCIKADDGAVRSSSWLHAAFNTGAGGELSPAPGPFGSLRASDLASVIDLVGLAASIPPADDRAHRSHRSGYKRGNLRDRADVSTLAAHGAAAADVMSHWPDAYHDVLDGIAHRNPEGVHGAFATSIGRLVVKPYLDLDGNVMPCLTEALLSFCTSRNIPHPNNRGHLQTSSVFRRLCSNTQIRDMAAALGTSVKGYGFRTVFDETLHAFRHRVNDDAGELATAFQLELRRRWNDHNSTMSSDEVSRYLDHPTHGRDLDPWIHPDLLTPQPDATKRHSRRRRHSFLKSDVEAIRDRLAERASATYEPSEREAFVPYSPYVKRLYGGDYEKTLFLLDILAGRIRICSDVTRPRLSEIRFDLAQATDASWSIRLTIIEKTDRFWVQNRIQALIYSLWPKRPTPASINATELWKLIKEGCQVRRRKVINATSGRMRPIYHYSLSDCLRMAHAQYGASVSPSVDARLAVSCR